MPDDVWHHDTLGWELGGVRPWLLQYDVTLGITDIEEALGNPAGGMHRGSAYDGATILGLGLDLDGLLEWTGASIGIYAAELRGHGLSTHAIGNLMAVSNIEVEPQVRLLDVYLDQSLWDDEVAIRFGEILPPDDFLASRYAAPFVNSTFTWPSIAGIDLPGEDPTDPETTPGARVKLTEDEITWQAGVYEAAASAIEAPAAARGPGSTGSGALVMSEATYTLATGPDDELPVTLKLGGWYHSAEFDDLRYGRLGRPLAELGSATPLRHQGDWGGYLGVDALLWRVPNSGDRGIGVFVRAAAAPPDRNLVQNYVDAGVILRGVLFGRHTDLLGVAFARAGISHAASGLDRDTGALLAEPYPVRDAETVVELTYQRMLAPWWTLQPDLQYVIHPGGFTANPEASAGYPPIRDALVLGLRSTIKF